MLMEKMKYLTNRRILHFEGSFRLMWFSLEFNDGKVSVADEDETDEEK